MEHQRVAVKVEVFLGILAGRFASVQIGGVGDLFYKSDKNHVRFGRPNGVSLTSLDTVFFTVRILGIGILQFACFKVIG